MNIILEPIPAPHPKPSLLHRKSTKDPASLAFCINDIFVASKTHHEQYILLRNDFFSTHGLVSLKTHAIQGLK